MKHGLMAANWWMVKNLSGIQKDKQELQICASMIVN